MKQLREDGALKPIGLALTAVVAGLGSAAQAAPVIATPADATRDPVQHEALRPLAGEAVEPFSNAAPEQQQDLFEL